MKIRKAVVSDVEGIAKVHVDVWRSAYKEILNNEFLNKITYEKRKKDWERYLRYSNIETIVCLNNKEEVIGFASFGPAKSKDHESELNAIYILEKYQRKGIGKLIIKEVVEMIKKMEMNSMMVWVLKDNESYKFYECLGGKKFIESDIEIGGKILKKVGYGWKDINIILEHL